MRTQLLNGLIVRLLAQDGQLRLVKLTRGLGEDSAGDWDGSGLEGERRGGFVSTVPEGACWRKETTGTATDEADAPRRHFRGGLAHARAATWDLSGGNTRTAASAR